MGYEKHQRTYRWQTYRLSRFGAGLPRARNAVCMPWEFSCVDVRLCVPGASAYRVCSERVVTGYARVDLWCTWLEVTVLCVLERSRWNMEPEEPVVHIFGGTDICCTGYPTRVTSLDACYKPATCR